MFHRFTARLILLCYGAIALGGQGLHLLVHEHEHDDCDAHVQVVASADGRVPNCISHSPNECEHDSEHCAVCQHHSLGQLFVATPPAEIVLGACESLSAPVPESANCPALFSPTQPRAPPIV